MPFDFAPLLASVVIAALGGAFAGFAGFGTGLLMAPLLTLVHPPQMVVPTLVAISLLGNFTLLPPVRSEVKLRRVLFIAIPSFVGLPIGIYALTSLDPHVVRRVVNAVVLILVGVLAAGVRFRRADTPLVLMPTGVASGLLSGIGGIGGPPVVLTLISIGDAASTMRANLIAYFTITGTIGVVMMTVAGVMNLASLKLLGVCLIPYFVTLRLGARRFEGSRDDSYRRIALAFLACVALVGLLWPA